MAFNPAIDRIDKESAAGQPRYGQYADFNTAGQAGAQYQQYQQMENAYQAPSIDTGRTGRLSLDDVFVKTAVLMGILLATATATWFLVEDLPGLASPIWLLGMFGSLALSFAIGFMKSVNVPLIVLHAVLQGGFVGAISYAFEGAYSGIIMAALTATVGTAVMMLVGWKMGLVKVTSRSMRIFSMMALGYLAFLLINLGLSWFGVFNAYATPFGWLIGLFGVAMAAYSLAIDFESIERGIGAGLPEKYSWLMGHGLVASLVWLYIEFLRLIAILRSGE
ncbi:Bax inhibitor-1/YccA family protein [Kytococcus sedentarius]|uniref:Bax inhibitor-1/YccA family protein n=1 Tax=Kytococcus sedentarius TaxID=1276 RepID=UPI0035BBDF91